MNIKSDFNNHLVSTTIPNPPCEKYSAINIAKIPISKYVGKSQALINRKAPIVIPMVANKIISWIVLLGCVLFGAFAMITVIAMLSTNSVYGRESRCACKSPNRNVKKGNSVIPSDSLGIIRVLA